MDSKGSLLVFTEVPESCKDAVQLLDLKVPQFAKLLRRIIKKLEKGTEKIEKPLIRLCSDGSQEKSGFMLVGTRETKNSDILFARLPNNEGSTEIYQLPFIRLEVRKTEVLPKIEENTADGDLKDKWKMMVEKLEHINSGVTSLLNIANKPKRASRPSSSLPNASQSGSKPPTKPIAAFPVPTNVSKPQSQPRNVNKPHPLDSTIDNVLASIRNGKDIDLGEKMRQKLQMPTVMEHTGSPHSALKEPEQFNLTPKNPRKRTISEMPSISLTFTPVQSTSVVKSSHVKNKVSPSKSAQPTTETNNVPWYHGLVETLDHEDVNYYDSSEQTPNKGKKHKSKKQKIQL